MAVEEEFFLTSARLRFAFPIDDLSVRFKCSIQVFDLSVRFKCSI